MQMNTQSRLSGLGAVLLQQNTAYKQLAGQEQEQESVKANLRSCHTLLEGKNEGIIHETGVIPADKSSSFLGLVNGQISFLACGAGMESAWREGRKKVWSHGSLQGNNPTARSARTVNHPMARRSMEWNQWRRIGWVIAGVWWAGICGCKTLFPWTVLPNPGSEGNEKGRLMSSQIGPPAPFPTLTDFASYPSRPGDVVRRADGNAWSSGPTPAEGPIASEYPPGGEADSPFPGRSDGELPAEKGRGRLENWPVWPVSSAAAALSTAQDPPLLAAVRAHVEGKPERALEALAMLEAENQDFVLALLPILSGGATTRWREEAHAAAELVGQLQALTDRLEKYAALRLGTVAFCHPVHGYRRYEPWPANTPYRPGDLAQLYIEVRNIGGQPSRGPRGESWLIQVQASVVIRDAHGQTVSMPDPLDRRRRVPVMRFEEKRYTRGPVRDYYLLCAFPVPEQPGVYTATVEVSDAAGRRSEPSSAVEFRVAGP